MGWAVVPSARSTKTSVLDLKRAEKCCYLHPAGKRADFPKIYPTKVTQIFTWTVCRRSYRGLLPLFLWQIYFLSSVQMQVVKTPVSTKSCLWWNKRLWVPTKTGDAEITPPSSSRGWASWNGGCSLLDIKDRTSNFLQFDWTRGFLRLLDPFRYCQSLSDLKWWMDC